MRGYSKPVSPRIAPIPVLRRLASTAGEWCAGWIRATTAIMLLVAMLSSAGCGEPAGDQRFKIQSVELNWSNGRLIAELRQSLELSNEAREAVDHGVPLTFQVELIMRNTSTQVRVLENLEPYEIRYLPLSERFQLTLPGGDEIKTFPRLRHLLADLADLRLSIRTGALPEGQYEVMTRTRLDMRKMPISMRLPTLLRSEWQHDSNWSSWPLDIGPQA